MIKQSKHSKSQTPKKDKEDIIGNDNISEIHGGSRTEAILDVDEDEDDMLDNLDKFIEGHDNELVKDHSDILNDDEKIVKRK